MKILKLQAENVKRLKVIEIKPDGSLIQVSGANGAGKSSVLDVIEYALAGEKPIPGQPIRRGEKSGKVVVDLGDGGKIAYTVTRTFNESGTQLFVRNENNDTFGSPQKFLDRLLGHFTFDPLEFVRMKPPQQLETLRGMVKLEVDIDELADLNKKDYDERRELKKQQTALESRITAITVPEGTPGAILDITTMVDALQRAAETNTALDREHAARKLALDRIEERRAEIAAKFIKIQTLRKEAEQLEVEAGKNRAKLEVDEAAEAARPALGKPVDTAKLAGDIEAARKTNEAVQRRLRREELLHEHTQATERLAGLDSAIKTRRQQGADAIRRAEMPLPGLGFDDDGVTFDELPLIQASSAEQLRVSVAMAMAMNPQVRVIRIKDGSLLDDNSLRMIAEMADASDYQVWMEVVDTTGTVGIVMEDGAIIATNPSTIKADKPKTTRKKKGSNDELFQAAR